MVICKLRLQKQSIDVPFSEKKLLDWKGSLEEFALLELYNMIPIEFMTIQVGEELNDHDQSLINEAEEEDVDEPNDGTGENLEDDKEIDTATVELESSATVPKEGTKDDAGEDAQVLAIDSQDLKLPLQEGMDNLKKDSLSPGLVDEDISSAEVSDRDAIDRVSPIEDEGPLTLEDLAMLENQSLRGLEEQFTVPEDGAILLSTHVMHDHLSAITEENSNYGDDSVDRLLNELDGASAAEDDFNLGNNTSWMSSTNSRLLWSHFPWVKV